MRAPFGVSPAIVAIRSASGRRSEWADPKLSNGRHRAARVTGDAFVRPEGFDLQAFANRTFGVYQDDAEHGEVVWRFRPEAAEQARSYSLHPEQSTTDEADGSLTVRFLASGHLEMCWHLYAWATRSRCWRQRCAPWCTTTDAATLLLFPDGASRNELNFASRPPFLDGVRKRRKALSRTHAQPSDRQGDLPYLPRLVQFNANQIETESLEEVVAAVVRDGHGIRVAPDEDATPNIRSLGGRISGMATPKIGQQHAPN